MAGWGWLWPVVAGWGPLGLVEGGGYNLEDGYMTSGVYMVVVVGI